MLRIRDTFPRFALITLAAALGSLANSGWAQEPVRVVVCPSWLSEPLRRLSDGRIAIQPFHSELPDSTTYESLNARWCAARTAGTCAFIFDGSSGNPLEGLWRERLSNQGNRTFTIFPCGRHPESRSSAAVLRQLHSLLIELHPHERVRWDANLLRELQQREPPRGAREAGELAQETALRRPAPGMD